MAGLAYKIAQKARSGAGQPRARVKTIAAPIKGWNAKDPISGMDPLFATILENWFPETGYVRLRGGNDVYAQGAGASVVESLFAYSARGTEVLIAGANGALYDASGGGTATSLSSASAFTSNRWQGENFYNYGILVNGADAPQKYDGSTLSAAGFTGTGLTASDLFYVASYKERLFLLEKDTANFWYGTVKQITGALAKFELGAVHPKGGVLVAAGSFTIDGGNGPDDYLAFFFKNGDIAVYQGTDPGDSDLWSIVGRFHIGPPIGTKPLLQIGSDLIAITADGYMPVRQFMGTSRTRKQLAVSDNISKAVNEAVKLYKDNYGWQLTLFPTANMLLANIPKVEGDQFEQHVMNTITGAWCKFTGMDAVCWAVHQDRLFFGGTDGTIHEAETGNADNGVNIDSDAQGAFVFYGNRESQKLFTLYKPYLQTDNPVEVSMGIGTNFTDGVVTVRTAAPVSEGAEFDVALFDVDFFAGGVTEQDDWQSAGEIGYSAAIRLQTQTMANTIKWFATSVVWQDAGIL